MKDKVKIITTIKSIKSWGRISNWNTITKGPLAGFIIRW